MKEYVLNCSFFAMEQRGVYREEQQGQANEGWNDEWCKRSGIANSGTYNNMYNAMLKSVYENGGFWIQRHLTRIGDSDCATGQNYASKASPDGIKTSSLLFGIQWDLVCKYLEVFGGLSEKEIREDSTSWGYYYNSSTEVQENEELRRKMNIYDFAGNGYEWTLESGGTNASNDRYPILRGGNFIIYGCKIQGTAALRGTQSTYSLQHSSGILPTAWRATFY